MCKSRKPGSDASARLSTVTQSAFGTCSFVTILSFNETTRTALLKGGFDTFSNVLVSQMLNICMSGESYAMAGMMSILSMVVIGAILIYTLARTERLERQARAMAEGSVAP